MPCNGAKRYWGERAAAGIIILAGMVGCAAPSGRSAACAPPISCTPLVVCAQPAPCAQAPAATPAAASSQTAPFSHPLFPPQVVMETGNYAAFVAENEQKRRGCEQGAAEECDVALFNLGFAYAHAASPYRNLVKAAVFFDDLSRQYPKSPYAFPARAWRAFILEQLALDGDLRTVQTHIREKDARIRALQEQVQRLRELDIKMQEQERELLQLR